MQCDLCGHVDPPLQRVNGWSICAHCSRNDVLQEALKASVQLKRLRDEVARREDLAAGASAKQKIAEQRIDAAKHELDEAITILALAIRGSSDTEHNAAEAAKALNDFESTQPAKRLHKRDED